MDNKYIRMMVGGKVRYIRVYAEPECSCHVAECKRSYHVGNLRIGSSSAPKEA